MWSVRMVYSLANGVALLSTGVVFVTSVTLDDSSIPVTLALVFES